MQRFLKFSKYLGEFGWKPLVVTPANGSYPYYDETLLNDIPENLEVFKTKTFEPFRIYNALQFKKGTSVPVAMIGMKDSKSIFQKASKFIRANWFIPDARRGWNKYALQEGRKVISEHKIDAIITTSPPHSTHLIGLKLKKEFQIPWMTDFRGPWTSIYFNKFLPRTSKTIAKDEELENRVLQNSDYVLVISEGLKKEFEDRNKNIRVIYNGYDERDVYDGDQTSTEKFSMLYLGNFKPNQNVSALWEVLSELISENGAFSSTFQLTFTGQADSFILAEIKRRGLEKVLSVNEFVPHLEATRQMAHASLLLFVIPKAENNSLIMTGKIFEYLSSRTPMLSIGPVDGDAAKLIKECSRDEMIDYDDRDGIKRQIMHYYNDWKNNDRVAFKHDKGNLHKFSRRSLTQELSETLGKMIEHA